MGQAGVSACLIGGATRRQPCLQRPQQLQQAGATAATAAAAIAVAAVGALQQRLSYQPLQAGSKGGQGKEGWGWEQSEDNSSYMLFTPPPPLLSRLYGGLPWTAACRAMFIR